MGYAFCGVLGCLVIPHLYPACKWFMVAVVFLSSPVFSVSLPLSCTQGADAPQTLASGRGHGRATPVKRRVLRDF